MKILAIRGKNIASLAGDFALDLKGPPLHGSGVFSLSGPTGAGKSTILDTMCLALYGKTPRTSRAGHGIDVPDPGGQTVSAQNPAQLLRKGTAEGVAEVDFIGSDGISYRARWSVRRARGRATAKLQDPEQGFWLLDDGQSLTGKRTETLRLITDKIGLDFDQFTRSVLLAQNDFAAFLLAEEDRRAHLLERLTGTEQFGRLSSRVFDRAKAESEHLAGLRREIGARRALDDSERATLDSAVQNVQAEETALTRRMNHLDAALQYRIRHEALLDNCAEAENALVLADSRRKEADSIRREWERTMRVQQEVKPLVDSVGHRREAVRAAEAETQSAEHEEKRATDALTLAQTALDRIQKDSQRLDEEALRIRPQLLHARTLDHDLDLAQDAESRARSAEEKARTEYEDHRHATGKARQDLATLEKRQEDDLAWLKARDCLSQLADGWASKREGLRRAVGRRSTIAAALTDARKLDSDVASKQGIVDTCARQVEAKRLDCAAKVARARDLDSTSCDDDLPALEQAQACAESDAVAHEQLFRLFQQHANLARSLDSKREQRANASTRAESLRRSMRLRKPELEKAADALATANIELRTAERMTEVTVERLRADLHEGQPCPVCGAKEHPFRGQIQREVEDHLRTQVSRQREEVAACTDRHAELQRAEESESIELSNLGGRLEMLDQTIADDQKQDSDLLGTLRLLPGALDLQALSHDERFCELERRKAILARSLSETRTRLEQAKARRRAAEEASRTASVAKDALVAANDAARVAEQDVLTARNARDAARRRVEQLEKDQESDIDPVASLLQELIWKSRWDDDPWLFSELLEEDMNGWFARTKARAARDIEIASIAGRIPDLEEREAKALRDAETRRLEAGRSSDARSALERQRACVFEGRAVAAVEEELEASRKAAIVAREGAQTAQQNARERAATARATLNEKQGAWDRCGELLQQSEDAVASWIADASGQVPPLLSGVEELAILLSRSDSWLRQQEDLVRQAQTEFDRATGKHENAKEALATHAEQRASVLNDLLGVVGDIDRPHAESLEPGWLRQTLATCREASERIRERRIDLLLQQRSDDEARLALASGQETIDRQSAVVERWDTLNRLVGSKDGKKLRHLAQEVTLDLVVVHANYHLAMLARRYRLERLPCSLNLVVVDDELLGEKRSVFSLSGGETFLVSLALALGLASLSAEKVRVETLFIDEGFGSLDAHTLQTAVEALDRLQSEGRQIGVISHVGDLAERLGTEVRVEPAGRGRSIVRVIGRR